MEPTRVTHASYYSYEGTLESPRLTHTDLSLEDFVMSGMDRDLDLALKGYGVVPPLTLMNDVFDRGQSGKAYSWEPFRISQSQYEELASALIEHAHEGFVIADRSLWSSPDFGHWFAGLNAKIRATPTFKKLAWGVQHSVLGIPLGEGRWIARDLALEGRKSASIDGVLNPLSRFFRGLAHCTPYCCRIEAFNFEVQNVLEQADKLGRGEVAGLLDAAIIDLQQLDASIEVFDSEMLNSKISRPELEQLLTHFVAVISRA